ncbi:MAG: aquaporin family protein [Mycoplasmataceae bacterium]|nr:aquaporin family protein [Mycoplasmataceae bacterium]
MNLGLVFFYEMLGTFVLLLIGLGINATATLKNTHAKGNAGHWLFVAFGWGVAIMMGVYFAQYTGGAINPAVALGLLIHGSWSWAEFGIGVVGELVGALLGSYLIMFIFWSRIKLHINNEKASISGIFITGESLNKKDKTKMSNLTNLIVEILGTFLLVFFVLLPTGIPTPIMAGLVVFGIGASIGSITGFAINPARDLMPRLALWTGIKLSFLKEINYVSANWSYAWITLFGPLIGSSLAGGLVYFL